MAGLYFIFPTLVIILISFLIVRAAAIALMMTGLDEKRAKFQALSAFSGTGFTTKEAESVVNNPRRRRIITFLMIMGNAGIVTVIVAATSSILTSRGYQIPVNVLILIVGVFVIYRVATHKRLIRRWESFVEDKLVKSHAFEESDTEDLLHLVEGYGLVRAIITDDSKLIDNTLSECDLSGKGLLVLGIERERKWIPVPKADEKLHNGDRLIVYGHLDVLRSLFRHMR